MKLSAHAKEMEPYFIKLIRSIVGDLEFAGVRVDLGQIWHVRTGTVVQYPYTAAGLATALAAASTGEMVYVPAGTITLTAGITVPAGVHLRGAGKEKTVLTHSGSVATLITLNEASVLSDLTSSLIYSGGSTARTISGNKGILRNVKTTINVSGNTTTAQAAYLNDLYAVAGEMVVSVQDCTFEALATGGEVSYLNCLSTDLDVANAITILRDCEFYAQTDGVHASDINSCVWLNCDQSTSRIIGYNLTVYSETQGTEDSNIVVSLDRATLISCDIVFKSAGFQLSGVDTNGVGDWIIDCKIAGTQSGETADDYVHGIAAYDTTYVINTYCVVTGGSGSTDGSIAMNYKGDSGLVLINSTFNGADDDIKILAGDTASIYGCQYDPSNVSIAGTLTYLTGDRADITPQYVTLATNTNLQNERVLTAGEGISLTDAGAGSTVTVAVQLSQDVTNYSDPPTDAELDAAFGEPGTLGRGFFATIDDNDGDADCYLVWTSDASWYYAKGTKAV